MYEQLLTHIGRYVTLSEKEQQYLVASLQYEEVPRKGFLLKAGAVCTGRYFVLSGNFRQYTIRENDTEQIVQFGLPGWWLCDYHSFEQQVPSGYYIQATAASSVAIITAAAQEELLQQVPALERYFRMVLQRACDAALSRINSLFSESGEERYLKFARTFPDFVQQVPQYMLASFLGLTPEFISMIRARRNK
ncbi:Crp/Fnr family transcriptional regulator [Chitinophaga nivalis]|uniref:Crp/Fnr family transcriptional regulator n=1 Tax=Chitinophaga nivalis TaxID=2991709 RepID=A0ABT3IMC3_9BACT|nr:Crp/Fnr family transcriptional regulator [Chitinophaga nivalis]MCW3465209.1 Crp/Fnr family transcriptional regulator [Chitinophaga nivalis]MCW3485099.1 Crp/Fnr family transcriptional regulator [Chitinophaga nivalis]